MQQNITTKNQFRILKGGKISLIVSAILITTTLLNAAPSGGVVTSGNASISQSGNVTNIHQSTQKASINWQKFSIAKHESVNFKQANSSSITLNRVIGNERSVINGALNANGQVWILNSNGVLFGKNAKINTSGFLATTAKLSDTDFQNGNYTFKNTTNNSIINQGTIEVVNNGSVILASNEVKNFGTIKAVKGKIHLVGSDSYSLNLNGNSLVNLKVEKGVLDALVENSGTILADGGEIYLTTNAVDELLKGVVNNTGIIEANSLDNLKGHVELFAHGGTAKIAGTISSKDGFVETSGKEFIIDKNSIIQAKTWLIDPTNLIVDDATAYETALNLGADTIIQTDNATGSDEGNIYVNDTITWNTAAKLTLDAYNDIFINKTITASHANGQVALYYGQGAVNAGNTSQYHIKAKVNLQAGDNFFTKLGSNGVETTWTVITDLGNEGSNTGTDLQGMQGDLTKNYVLGADIDASSTASWNSNKGWKAIGNTTNRFTGHFDGLGHVIDGLTIDRATKDYQGLFGIIDIGSIQNIGLTNVDITGKDLVGGLVGGSIGTIQNSYATGTVSGNHHVGGLVGWNELTIQNSYAIATVSGNNHVGGLVGWNQGATIQNSYATGTVSGNSHVGGLLGTNHNGSGTITASYYDNETNTGAMSDSASYGKTKAEIISLAKANWDKEFWIADGIDVTGYSTDTFTLPELQISYTPTTSAILFNAGFGTESNPYTITNWNHLQNINNSNILTQNYYFYLVNDLLTTTEGYTTQVKNGASLANGGKGWKAIGDNSNKFVGHFDGTSHTIDGLTINRATEDSQGLFGIIDSGSTIKNIGLTNIDITGRSFVGGLAGDSRGTIQSSYATGDVSGNTDVGGLVGVNRETIQNSYAIGTVSGNLSAGGLVGSNYRTIENSYATGTVSGNNNLGGLVGNDSGTITASYYDNETNTGAMNDSASYGKTKTELASLAKDNWDIEEDNTVERDKLFLAWQESGKGYTKTWVVGTKGISTPDPTPTPTPDSVPTPTPTPDPTPTPTPDSVPTPTPDSTNQETPNLENIITSILNQTITKKDLAGRKISILQEENEISNKNIGVIPNVKLNKPVTLSEVKTEQTSQLRVLVENSSISIVNNGLNLPIGIEQIFYVEGEK